MEARVPTVPAGLVWAYGILRRFRLSLLLLVVAVVYGTLGYQLLESWSAIDSLYMTVITLTTVGFAEVNPLDGGGRIFTISVLLLGLVAVFSAVGAGTELLASGELGKSLRRRRVQQRVGKLRDQFIVCGYGRVGAAAADELLADGVDVVVIDPEPGHAAALDDAGIPHIVGDATEEAVLKEAGIEVDQGMVCAVDSDEANVYITITARALNPDLRIVARAGRPESVETLRRAGANRIVSPYAVSGKQMAFLSLRPAVVDFIDLVTLAPDLRLEEVRVDEGSPLVGATVSDAHERFPGSMILAVKRHDSDLVASPGDGPPLSPGDLVVVLGSVAALESMSG